MSRDFIDQVRALIMSNISDEKFGKQSLASKLGLSPSQTLRKVKAATGKSVNRYIRELRLEKAAKLIKNTDHTIAEISYQVGFGSPSYFNKAFVNYYGIAPGEYKTKSTSLSELAAIKTKNTPPKGSLKKIFYPLIIVLVFVIGYLLINNSTSKKTSFSNSIAVLPFKDLSPENSQWFSDGVSDNIIHSLSQIQDLSVISFTSSSTYRNTDKQIPKIAKELGVSYILEGSVVLYEDKIKIIAQLINAKDEHIWSKEYNTSFDDIITIQNNVAQEVMNQLEVTLSLDEMEILEKYPTQNMEAYSLYLKGRLLQYSRTKEDLELNIELNKKAISLDSNFADAYGEVANSYFLLFFNYSNTIDPFEARENADHYADKALAIDPNTIRALTAKGNLNNYVDWEKADRYFKKAIAISPNDVLTRLHFAQNALVTYTKDGERELVLISLEIKCKRYLEEMAFAYKLDPLSSLVSDNYILTLIGCKKLDEAETFLQKNSFLLSEGNKVYFPLYIKALRNKDWSGTKSYFEKRIEEDPGNPANYLSLAIYYRDFPYDLAKALELCEQAYQLDSAYIWTVVLALIKNNKFEEAKELMSSETYKSNRTKKDQLLDFWYYNYEKNDIKKALEILNDSAFKNQYWERTLTYAKAGNRKKVDSMNKKYPWDAGDVNIYRRIKSAILYALLKDRDSMYFYLENHQYNTNIYFPTKVNEYGKEFDPYRNEDRFKAFLKKWYLPVSSE